MKWTKLIQKSDQEFRRITGIKKITFSFLIKLLQPKWNERRKAGGRKPKLKLEDQLLLALSYWRNYGTYLETGAKYSVSESRAWGISRWVEDTLIHEKALHLPGKKALLGKNNFEIVVFDVTECPIERPKRKKTGGRKNKRNWSAKYFYKSEKYLAA